MGSRGPTPKRDAERRRENKRNTETLEAAGPVAPPPPDPHWHKVALMTYQAGIDAVASVYYDSTDWAQLWALCESKSRALKPQIVGFNKLTGRVIRARIPIPGSTLVAWAKIEAGLLFSEGDRRRVGLEISRPSSSPEPAAGVTVIDEYRDRFAR